MQGRQPLLVTHGGQTDGFTALVTFDRERGVGTVLLANSSDARPWFSRNLLWLDPWPSEPGHEVPPAVVERYTGTYSTAVGRYMAAADQGRHLIRLDEEGGLTYQRPGGVRVPLRPRADTAFYMVGVPFTLAFSPRADGPQMVASVDEREPLRQQGQRWKAWRVDEEAPPVGEASTPSGLSIALVALLAGGLMAVAVPFWRRRGRA